MYSDNRILPKNPRLTFVFNHIILRNMTGPPGINGQAYSETELNQFGLLEAQNGHGGL